MDGRYETGENHVDVSAGAQVSEIPAMFSFHRTEAMCSIHQKIFGGNFTVSSGETSRHGAHKFFQ